MKRIIFICLLGILALSCGSDELVINNSPQDNIIGNVSLTEKLRRVSQYPTTIDNIIDNSSCFAIQFPYTVIANGQTVNVNDALGYQEVKDIFNANGSDVDAVVIQFPVDVIYADYSEASFATQTQFNEAVLNCTGSIELACMGFNFPLAMKTYRSHDQLAQTINLTTKKGLFEFLSSMENYDVAGFDYPITFNIPGGNEEIITVNNQLESVINDFTDECMAGIDPGPTPGSFEEVIMEGSWYVSYFFRDSDQTDDYEDYDFIFNSNGTVTVTGGSSPGTGTWISYTDSGELITEFTFTSSALEELVEDWTVTEFTETQIKMEHVSGGGDDIRYLYLTRN